MAEQLTMPKLGMDMTEGTFITWTKNVGDKINPGDVIAEIETDKTTIEVEATAGGTILAQLVEPGQVVKVGSLIGWVGEAGEAVPGGAQPAAVPAAEPAKAAAASTPQSTPAAPPPATPKPASVPAPAAPSGNGEGYPEGVKASPIARNIAKERGIDLKLVTGSGPGGRITKTDVENFTPTAPAPAQAGRGIAAASYPELPGGPDVEVIDTSNLRKRIANRMVDSKQQVPHFYVTSDIDVEPLLELRKQLNANVTDDAQKITVNDLVVKATALALRQFPNLNTHFYGDKIVRHKRINIGIAVALPNGGLINVVAKDADKTALGTMAARNKEMIARVLEGKVKPDDLEGGTFTVSNMGMYDVEDFVAIINPPEAAILAIGSAKKVPVVKEDGTLGVGQRMKITISVDHRVSDGAEGAKYLQHLKELLETPLKLVL
jgi:pyruvate dehydrogenase E2 component (dihydrolipoamide acetyltransferase)